MGSPWRTPDEESEPYPGFWVHDGRQAGSITIGRTRLPVWAVVADLVYSGWRTVAEDYDAECSGTVFAGLVHDVFQARGEFGRLLLVLANAERLDSEARLRALDAAAPDGGLVNITPGDPDAVQLPPRWWDDPDLSAPVVDQLERCLAVFTTGATDGP